MATEKFAKTVTLSLIALAASTGVAAVTAASATAAPDCTTCGAGQTASTDSAPPYLKLNAPFLKFWNMHKLNFPFMKVDNMLKLNSPFMKFNALKIDGAPSALNTSPFHK